MQVQRPELDVQVEAERTRARFGDCRSVETQKNRRDSDGERAVRRCGQSDGDERRQGEKRHGEDVRETLTKSHETRRRPISCQIQTVRSWRFGRRKWPAGSRRPSVCSVVGRRRAAFELSRALERAYPGATREAI